MAQGSKKKRADVRRVRKGKKTGEREKKARADQLDLGTTPGSWVHQYEKNLAIGIGIQNFPEGLAVSLPLKAFGFSLWKSFWYGQLSGMVEPIFGILGALAVSMARPLLPYALSFAAGAMIYVVVDDIIPEASSGIRSAEDDSSFMFARFEA
ncbi:hypothetical protein RUM44_002985 [Polyplax serrata]|uniref:Zinc transporter ZIP11 n=1 Tax=Polyplax serrata TaxID=468196 RepID=A0ABR1AX93_POLSC